jgi:hypothetical protein
MRKVSSMQARRYLQLASVAPDLMSLPLWNVDLISCASLS